MSDIHFPLWNLESDAGPFLLARPGLYVRETNSAIILLHSKAIAFILGFLLLSMKPYAKNGLKNVVWNSTFVSRVNYVSYPSKVAFSRQASLQWLLLWHLEMKEHLFHTNWNNSILLSIAIIFWRWTCSCHHLAREAVFLFWNFAQHSGLGGLDIDHILTSMTFQNHAGESIHCDSLPFHPIKDATYVQSMWHLFNNHRTIASRYHIGIHQTWISFQAAATEVS